MENGLLGFGDLNYGLLSPTQIAAMSAPQQYPTGTFNQTLPADYQRPVPKPGDQYDPYYLLRNIPGLLDNPNFAWLRGFDTGPLNVTLGDPLDPKKYPGASTGGGRAGGLGGVDLSALPNGGLAAPFEARTVGNFVDAGLNTFDLSNPSNRPDDIYQQAKGIPNAFTGEVAVVKPEYEDVVFSTAPRRSMMGF